MPSGGGGGGGGHGGGGDRGGGGEGGGGSEGGGGQFGTPSMHETGHEFMRVWTRALVISSPQPPRKVGPQWPQE